MNRRYMLSTHSSSFAEVMYWASSERKAMAVQTNEILGIPSDTFYHGRLVQKITDTLEGIQHREEIYHWGLCHLIEIDDRCFQDLTQTGLRRNFVIRCGDNYKIIEETSRATTLNQNRVLWAQYEVVDSSKFEPLAFIPNNLIVIGGSCSDSNYTLKRLQRLTANAYLKALGLNGVSRTTYAAINKISQLGIDPDDLCLSKELGISVGAAGKRKGKLRRIGREKLGPACSNPVVFSNFLVSEGL